MQSDTPSADEGWKWVGTPRDAGATRSFVGIEHPITFPGVVFRAGSCVLVNQGDEAPVPFIALIERLYEQQDLDPPEKLVAMRWFYRPRDCTGAKLPDDVEENEIFLSDLVDLNVPETFLAPAELQLPLAGISTVAAPSRLSTGSGATGAARGAVGSDPSPVASAGAGAGAAAGAQSPGHSASKASPDTDRQLGNASAQPVTPAPTLETFTFVCRREYLPKSRSFRPIKTGMVKRLVNLMKSSGVQLRQVGEPESELPSASVPFGRSLELNVAVKPFAADGSAGKLPSSGFLVAGAGGTRAPSPLATGIQRSPSILTSDSAGAKRSELRAVMSPFASTPIAVGASVIIPHETRVGAEFQATIPPCTPHLRGSSQLVAALQQEVLVPDSPSCSATDTSPDKEWSADEVKEFCVGFNRHGKSFHLVARGIPTRTTSECVEFFYRNKYRESRPHLRDCVLTIPRPSREELRELWEYEDDSEPEESTKEQEQRKVKLPLPSPLSRTPSDGLHVPRKPSVSSESSGSDAGSPSRSGLASDGEGVGATIRGVEATTTANKAAGRAGSSSAAGSQSGGDAGSHADSNPSSPTPSATEVSVSETGRPKRHPKRSLPVRATRSLPVCTICLVQRQVTLVCLFRTCGSSVCSACYSHEGFRSREGRPSFREAERNPFWLCGSCCPPPPRERPDRFSGRGRQVYDAAEAPRHSRAETKPSRRKRARSRNNSLTSASEPESTTSPHEAAASPGQDGGDLPKKKPNKDIKKKKKQKSSSKGGIKGGAEGSKPPPKRPRSEAIAERDEHVRCVEEALTLLERIDAAFAAKPAVYTSFLLNLEQFQLGVLSEMELATRVNDLLASRPDLLDGFRAFLSPRVRDLSTDPLGCGADVPISA